MGDELQKNEGLRQIYGERINKYYSVFLIIFWIILGIYTCRGHSLKLANNIDKASTGFVSERGFLAALAKGIG